MFVHLLDIVQASEEELLEALKKLHACNIDGKWSPCQLELSTIIAKQILDN